MPRDGPAAAASSKPCDGVGLERRPWRLAQAVKARRRSDERLEPASPASSASARARASHRRRTPSTARSPPSGREEAADLQTGTFG